MTYVLSHAYAVIGPSFHPSLWTTPKLVTPDWQYQNLQYIRGNELPLNKPDTDWRTQATIEKVSEIVAIDPDEDPLVFVVNDTALATKLD